MYYDNFVKKYIISNEFHARTRKRTIQGMNIGKAVNILFMEKCYLTLLKS